MSQKMDTHSGKITPPGLTTTVANMAQDLMGPRDTITTNLPNARPGETMLSLQWYGNKGKSHRKIKAGDQAQNLIYL
jgi:hypothetical protein